jgi:hypothetical protein
MGNTLTQEQLKVEVVKALENMGCDAILFPNSTDVSVPVVFNCKELTSFMLDLPGWAYSGIQLDPTGTGQYRIMFVRKE